jgi:hypothetical protein
VDPSEQHGSRFCHRRSVGLRGGPRSARIDPRDRARLDPRGRLGVGDGQQESARHRPQPGPGSSAGLSVAATVAYGALCVGLLSAAGAYWVTLCQIGWARTSPWWVGSALALALVIGTLILRSRPSRWVLATLAVVALLAARRGGHVAQREGRSRLRPHAQCREAQGWILLRWGKVALDCRRSLRQRSLVFDERIDTRSRPGSDHGVASRSSGVALYPGGGLCGSSVRRLARWRRQRSGALRLRGSLDDLPTPRCGSGEHCGRLAVARRGRRSPRGCHSEVTLDEFGAHVCRE